MKKILIVFCISFYGFEIYGQNIVSPTAFNKYILDQYNFAIIGSQTPTTGFKVETNKPTITLKGNILFSENRRLIMNLELEGGLDNGLMQIVSGKDVSNYLKANVGANFLLGNNKASHYVITRTEDSLNRRAYYMNKLLLSKKVDTFLVIKTITDHPEFHTYNYEKLRDAVIEETKKKRYRLKGFTRSDYSDINTYYGDLIRNILLSYGTNDNANNDILLQNFRTQINTVGDTTIKAKKFLNTYDRIKEEVAKTSNTLTDSQSDFEMELTKVNWTTKKLKWINVSTSVMNNSFKLYDISTKVLIDSSSFLPGISASYNWLFKGKESNKFSYFKIGTTIQKTNSLVDQQKFNYKKETILSISPTEELKSTKEGTAYTGSLIEKLGFDIFFEGYCVPWKKDFIPGFYVKTMYRNSSAWINKNKLSFDIGTVWNVTNNDKDAKNLLSIVPFFSWSNILKEYKDVGKTQKKEMSDLFTFNIKFGIPVNLGK